MTLKQFNKLSAEYIATRWLWKILEEYFQKQPNGISTTVYKGLKKLTKKTKRSKNTLKKYLELFKEGANAFYSYFLIPQARSNAYPIELSKLVIENYENWTERIQQHKNAIPTFKGFWEREEYKTYSINGKQYTPSISYVHHCLLDHGYVSNLSRKSTKRRAKKRKENFENFEKKDLTHIENLVKISIYNEINNQIKNADKTSPSNEKVYIEGERIEQDSWEFPIFHNIVTLTHTIDSGTGAMIGAIVTKRETNAAHIMAFGMAIERKGLPLSVITDRRAGWFGESKAQLRDVAEGLFITSIQSSIANWKAKVERTNRTLNNDFMTEWLIDNNITSIDDFNLKIDKFIHDYNKKYKKKSNTKESLYKPSTYYDLEQLFVEYEVKVLPDQTLIFQKEKYGFFNKRGERVYVPTGKRTLRFNYKGEISFTCGNKMIYCKKDFKNHKVNFYTLQELQQFKKELEENSNSFSKKEVQDIIAMFDYSIQKIIDTQNI